MGLVWVNEDDLPRTRRVKQLLSCTTSIDAKRAIPHTEDEYAASRYSSVIRTSSKKGASTTHSKNQWRANQVENAPNNAVRRIDSMQKLSMLDQETRAAPSLVFFNLQSGTTL